MDPVAFQGLTPNAPEGSVRLLRPEPADRPLHAQPACAAGLLARRERQPERHLYRMLHGRARPCGRPGSAGVPPQAAWQDIRSTRRCSTPSAEKVGWGKPAPQGVFRGIAQFMGYRQLCRRRRRDLGDPTAASSRSIASSRPPIRATPSIRRRSNGRSPARSSTGCRRCSTARSPSRTARIEQTNFDTYNDADRARCRRSRPSSCRPAASGAASASRPSAVAAPAVLNAYLRRDRQAHPFVPADASRHPHGLTD